MELVGVIMQLRVVPWMKAEPSRTQVSIDRVCRRHLDHNLSEGKQIMIHQSNHMGSIEGDVRHWSQVLLAL